MVPSWVSCWSGRGSLGKGWGWLGEAGEKQGSKLQKAGSYTNMGIIKNGNTRPEHLQIYRCTNLSLLVCLYMYWKVYILSCSNLSCDVCFCCCVPEYSGDTSTSYIEVYLYNPVYTYTCVLHIHTQYIYIYMYISMCIYVCVYIYVYIYIYICRHRSNRIAGFLATALRQVPFSVVPSLQTPGAEWGAPRGVLGGSSHLVPGLVNVYSLLLKMAQSK